VLFFFFFGIVGNHCEYCYWDHLSLSVFYHFHHCEHCLWASCTNPSLSRNRGHVFSDVANGASFPAWIHFVQVKRRDFADAAVTTNKTICGTPFSLENMYLEILMNSRWHVEARIMWVFLSGSCSLYVDISSVYLLRHEAARTSCTETEGSILTEHWDNG